MSLTERCDTLVPISLFRLINLSSDRHTYEVGRDGGETGYSPEAAKCGLVELARPQAINQPINQP